MKTHFLCFVQSPSSVYLPVDLSKIDDTTMKTLKNTKKSAIFVTRTGKTQLHKKCKLRNVYHSRGKHNEHAKKNDTHRETQLHKSTS